MSTQDSADYFIIVQKIHKAPWILQTSVEYSQQIEVVVGSRHGYGHVIFRTLEDAETALGELHKQYHRSNEGIFRNKGTNSFQEIYEIRKIRCEVVDTQNLCRNSVCAKTV